MDKINLIISELERRIEKYWNSDPGGLRWQECQSLLSFVKSLQEEENLENKSK